jgi:VIT1/CCC1 family predicted Fe2+/Mn2+ transporter
MSLTARYDKAREAFSKKDSLASKNLHNIMPLEPAEEHRTAGNHIKSLIYGGLDGTLTTFSLVCGVAGAQLAPNIILILGAANLIGDGFGMAVGDYLSTKAEMEYQQREKKREIWEFENYPEGEKAEMVAIYKTKGIAEKDAKNIVDKMAGHKDAFIDVMMVEELGMGEKNEMPLVNAVVTFFSFAVFGLIPLLVYLIAHFVVVNDLFLIATILTAATMFILGAVKTRITQRNWFASGFEMLLVGGIAAAAAYLVGYMLHGLA